MTPQGDYSERGAGTVLVLGIVAVIVLLAWGIAALGSAQNARAAAQMAADLGALAGATALRDGLDPCETAGATIMRNKAQIASCEVLGAGVVQVVVIREAVSPGVGGTLGQARASARAGPRRVDSQSSRLLRGSPFVRASLRDGSVIERRLPRAPTVSKAEYWLLQD